MTCYRRADVADETKIRLLLFNTKNNNDSLLGWTLPKICIIPKNASNKSFSASNFGQKSLRGHLSISPQSGARGLERWYGLNMKLCRNGKIHSLLGWTLPKIHIIQKKASNKNCLEFLFSYSVSVQFHISTISFFEHSSSLWKGGGDRHMPLWTFLSEIRCRKTFIRSFFGDNAYFQQCSAQRWIIIVFYIK